MANVSYALTTKEKVKQQLNISTVAFDDMINGMIYAATDFIESRTARRFQRTMYSNKLFNSSGGSILFLPNYPISALTALEYRGGSWGTPTFTAYNSNDYLLYADAGYIQFSYSIPKFPQHFRVSYTAGYLIDFENQMDSAKHTLPFDLTQLCTEIVARMYAKRRSQGKSQENVEGQGISWNSDLSKEQQSTLSKYRNKYV